MAADCYDFKFLRRSVNVKHSSWFDAKHRFQISPACCEVFSGGNKQKGIRVLYSETGLNDGIKCTSSMEWNGWTTEIRFCKLNVKFGGSCNSDEFYTNNNWLFLLRKKQRKPFLQCKFCMVYAISLAGRWDALRTRLGQADNFRYSRNQSWRSNGRRKHTHLERTMVGQLELYICLSFACTPCSKEII